MEMAEVVVKMSHNVPMYSNTENTNYVVAHIHVCRIGHPTLIRAERGAGRLNRFCGYNRTTANFLWFEHEQHSN